MCKYDMLYKHDKETKVQKPILNNLFLDELYSGLCLDQMCFEIHLYFVAKKANLFVLIIHILITLKLPIEND